MPDILPGTWLILERGDVLVRVQVCSVNGERLSVRLGSGAVIEATRGEVWKVLG
jgi:hypothetical protein